MIFWIDNTSIYDCRTYSLIKPQQYDVAIILDYIKQDQQQNRIDLKDKLPKLLRTLALLLVIHNKKDIFRLLQILASKDFKYTKLYNDFANNPAAQWYIEQMKVESVQMIMNQYIQGEYKFLESFFQKIINSYEQYLQKQQNEQGTPEFNQQVEVVQNQDQTSQNKINEKSQQNQQQQNQINQNQGIKGQIEESINQRKKSVEENNLEKDSISSVQKSKNDIKNVQDTKNLNQITNKESTQKQNLDVIQQQQLNKDKISKTTIEIEDKPQQQQNEQNNNKQKINQQQQLGIKNQKEQNNLENQKGNYFSEQQKVSLESVFKDDKPDQKMLEMAKILSEKAQKKSTYSPLQSPSKFKPNPKPLEKITEKVEKRVNIEQKIAKKFNQEPEKINSYIDTLTDKEQQEFEFSEDTELIKLFDLLKDKCEQTYWWSKFQDKCNKAMMEKELEMIMFDKLPILMKRWAIKTGKNVTEMDRNPNRRHRTPIQETKNTLLDYSDPEEMTKEIIHIAQSSETLDKKQKNDENINLEQIEQNNNGINKLQQQNEVIIKQSSNYEQEESIKQNLQNEFKYSSEFQQHNSKFQYDNINKENENFISRLEEDTFINQNQQILVEQELLLQNEIQEVTPYQIIDIDDEIYYKNSPMDNQKNQQSKVIKTCANRLNTEITSSRQQQSENPNKQYLQQETSFQSNIEKQKNVIFIDSSNDEIIQSKNTQQLIPQQQQTIQITEDCVEIINQPIIKSNIIYPNIQSEFNQHSDDIDKLFQNDNDLSSPDSMVSSQSILISNQSSIQFDEVQNNKNQFVGKEQLNQQKNQDIIKIPDKILEKNDVKKHRDEEQKTREKKNQESDIEIKEKQKNKNNKRQNSKDKSENQKTKSKKHDSKNDEKDKSRAKSSSQNNEKFQEKEKSKETKKRKSSEKKNAQDIIKIMQAEKEAKEKQKEEQKKKEKEKIHQENIKKAEQRLNKMRCDEIEYQKEYNYLQQQSKQNEIEPGEIKQQQQQQNQNQHKSYQQPQQLSQQNYKNVNQTAEQNQRLKSQDGQIIDPQILNTSQKYQQYNQQVPQKIQESQSNGNRPQQFNQNHEIPISYISDQTSQYNNVEYQKNHQTNQQQYNQFDRQQQYQINQNQIEQIPGQQNQYQRQNSYAFPLEQYGIQEFLTKKDQAMQKSVQKQIVNPTQYDLAQIPPSITNQGNYQKQQQQQQQYPQNYQQVQFQPQQQQQQQQQQFFNQQKQRDKKYRNNQPHQQDFYRQKQQYQNQLEPHLQKQRKYNPNNNNEQHVNNQNFNYMPGPQPNMNVQPYPYHNQMNDPQFANQNPFPNGPNYSSNQPSKQQMFEFFCQMFYDKFQQPE
ncbi:unnamed protein product [Paramecium primaurelia]|uniref:Uncharacterized protein n=1 Tax=Paramecium primaurelia TaxID=5886 RepID=A0A8S1JZM2_PARPR|nr:unnamed protein product [Paramecium primaurelia]